MSKDKLEVTEVQKRHKIKTERFWSAKKIEAEKDAIEAKEDSNNNDKERDKMTLLTVKNY